MSFNPRYHSDDADLLECEYGLKCPPPSTHLKRILANYPEGTQIFKEAIQNADDAGATKIEIILDQRRHSARTPSMDRFMGAAVLLYNDGVFSAKDWISLQSMFESVKMEEVSKIGKFGMGSRSYFHMTDIVTIVSGSTYAYIDPDYILSAVGGERINYVSLQSKWRASDPTRYDLLRSHLQVLEGVKQFAVDKPFNGTLMRLPLRLGRYARESRFAPYEYTPSKISRIFQSLTAELDSCLLFLQSLNTITISQWNDSEDAPLVLAQAQCQILRKEDCELDEIALMTDAESSSSSSPSSSTSSSSATDWSPRGKSPLRDYLKEFDSVQALRDSLLSGDSGIQPRLQHLLRIKHTEQNQNAYTFWKVALQIQTDFDLVQLIETTGLAPIVGVAMPLGRPTGNIGRTFSDDRDDRADCHSTNQAMDRLLWPIAPIEGKLFSYLPIANAKMPGLPFHIHANFCLTDNRRSLWLDPSGQDTEGRAQGFCAWNRILLYKSAAALAASELSSIRNYDCAMANWPDPSVEGASRDFLKAFASSIQDVPLFDTADGSKASIQECRVVRFSEHSARAFVQMFETEIKAGNTEINARDMMIALRSIGCKHSRKAVVTAPGRFVKTFELLGEKCAVSNWSFLNLMHQVVLPHWSENLTSLQLTRQPYFIHWMLMLCRTLTASPINEACIFRPFCEELKFVPCFQTNIRQKQLGVLMNDEIDALGADGDGMEVEGNYPAYLNVQCLSQLSKTSWRLLAPSKCYDCCLKSFKIAHDNAPSGSFGTPAVLRILRTWGMKQTLSWADMTQEIVFRLCHTEQPNSSLPMLTSI